LAASSAFASLLSASILDPIQGCPVGTQIRCWNEGFV
jgi:hypothetical protein